MNYKDTLTLPHTTYPQWVEQPDFEKETLTKFPVSLPTHPTFHLHGGPPFANGNLHFGHFLNVALKDFVVRSQTLLGNPAALSLGWDCHGLPLEQAVVKTDPSLRLTPERLREACSVRANEFVEVQKNQLRRVGLLHPLTNYYTTMTPNYEADELLVWASLQEKGYVYQAYRPTLWSYGCQTALAEAEVDYKDQDVTSAYVRFPSSLKADLLVWTTQPWTLLANRAVAYRKGTTYKRYQTEGDDVVVAEDLATQLGLTDGVEVSLEGVTYHAPYSTSSAPVYPADFVSTESGTGLVHLAPAHGPDDYKVCYAYPELDLTHTVNAKGEFDDTTNLETVRNTNVFKANPLVLDDLTSRNLLYKTQELTHRYPFCWRSQTPLLYRATKQWFVSLTTLKEQAKVLAEAVTYYPASAKNRFLSSLASRTDWCVSRQRAWGLPLPVFYAADGSAVSSPELTRKVAKLFQTEGSQVWFTKSSDELAKLLDLPSGLTKGTDTLDVWLDSGSSCKAVLNGTQADMYLEGSDQHRGWFQSSLYVSTALYNQAPFKALYTHGFVQDSAKAKFSKKQGSKPLDYYVDVYGAEVLRLWVASQNSQEDVTFDEKELERLKEFLRTFRNTVRVLKANMGSDTTRPSLTAWSNAYLARLAEFKNACLKSYTTYAFHEVLANLVNFCKNDFSAKYFETLKDSLYCDTAQDSQGVRYTLQVTYHVLTSLLSPLVPVTVTDALATSVCPTLQTSEVDQKDLAFWYQLLALKDDVNYKAELHRREHKLGKLTELTASVPSTFPSVPNLATVLGVSTVVFSDSVSVDKHQGTKCPRCWKYHDEPKELCLRCESLLYAYSHEKQ